MDLTVAPPSCPPSPWSHFAYQRLTSTAQHTATLPFDNASAPRGPSRYYPHHDEAYRQGFCRINSAALAVGHLSLSNSRVMPPPCHQPRLIPPMICYLPWNAAASPPQLLCLPLQATPLSGPSIAQLRFVILQYYVFFTKAYSFGLTVVQVTLSS